MGDRDLHNGGRCRAGFSAALLINMSLNGGGCSRPLAYSLCDPKIDRRHYPAHLPAADGLVERAHKQVRGPNLEDLLKQPLQRETAEMPRRSERQRT